MKAASRAAQCARRSSPRWPGRRGAGRRWRRPPPPLGSARPCTAASATAGWAAGPPRPPRARRSRRRSRSCRTCGRSRRARRGSSTPPRSPVCRTGPAPGRRSARDEDLARRGDRHPRAEQRHAVRGDLRARLREPVGRGDRDPGAARALQQRGVSGAPPSSAQRSAGGSRRPASSSRASVVGTSETSVGRGSCSSASTRSVSKRSCRTDAGRRVDRAAQEDRQAADVGERQRAQPAVGGVDAERRGRAQRAPQPVAVGELDGPRRRSSRTCGRRSHGVEVVPPAKAGAAARRRAARRPRARCPRDRRRARPARRRSIGTATAPSSRHPCSATQNASPAGSARPTRSPGPTPRAASPPPPPRARRLSRR